MFPSKHSSFGIAVFTKYCASLQRENADIKLGKSRCVRTAGKAACKNIFMRLCYSGSGVA